MIKAKPLYLPPTYQEGIDSGAIVMRDGKSASISKFQKEDMPDLVEFYKRQSPESIASRFFSPQKPSIEQLEEVTLKDNPDEGLTLIVRRIAEGKSSIVATATYAKVDQDTAEFSVTVDDHYQGRGLGGILLERLSVIATRNGFTKFQALTSDSNSSMLEIFRNSGFMISEDHEEGTVTVELTVTPNEVSSQASEMRERVAVNASIRPFFVPKSVAVIGASRKENNIGFRILDAMISSKFEGTIYPINPKARVVHSLKAYPSVKDVPEDVDLAVIVLPAEYVGPAVDECAAKNVRAVLVISAGFAEYAGGRDLQKELMDKIRGYGMRMIGPNCLGIINTNSDVRLNASFSPLNPPAGNIAMASQSGALGLVILALAKRLHVGLSSFVSMGNKADVSGNDLLLYWAEDPDTKVILMYLEGFKNPRRFMRIARSVGRSKPIIAVKGGRTDAGKRAAGSHTAAMAGSDVPATALFGQTGVIRADSLEDQFDMAQGFSCQPLPKSKKCAIVTNAGGPGILCADACEAGGLVLPELSKKLQDELRTFLPPAAGYGNPVDMIASASPEQFKKTLVAVMKSGEVDSVIVSYIPVGTADDQDIIKAINDGVREVREEGLNDVPVIANLMLAEGRHPPLEVGLNGERIPNYIYPESAAKVLATMAGHAAWKNRELGMVLDFPDADPKTARRICRDAIAERGDGWLSGEETRELLEAFKLPVPAGGVGPTADEAAAIAEKVGFPVAAKLASKTLVHKTEFGGVFLGLKSADEVKDAFNGLQKSLEEKGYPDAMDGLLIQPMIKGDAEVMVGVTDDPTFGPLIAFGLGGVHVEILKDVNFRVTPLTDRDAKKMVRSIKGYRLLEGYRGSSPADVEAIEELLMRVSLLVEEVPEITEIDMNPIFALKPGEGCCIVDCRIKVREPQAGQPIRLG